MDFLLKPPRRVHGLDPNCQWEPPPMDGSLTVPEIYDFHLQHNPEHPVFVYADNSGKRNFITYSRLVPAAYRAARHLVKLLNIDLGASDKTNRPLIAILAASDTITYFTTILGMLRAQIPIFPISPRNSAPAVAHLFDKTLPSHVLVSVDAPIQELVQAAIEQLKGQGKNTPDIINMPLFEQLYNDKTYDTLPPQQRDYRTTTIIVHSSGSSSFPKPIKWNDRSYLQVAMVPQFGTQDLCGRIIACHGVPMFHAIGLNLIAWHSGSGFVIGVFPPASSATTPTPSSVYQGLLNVSPAYAFGVPAFIEEWSCDPAKIAYLRRLKGLVYGGTTLNKGVGDLLAAEGVSIYTFYGQTEIGVIGMIFPENAGLDWEYVTLNPHCAAEFVPMGDGTYELVAVKRPTHELPVINTKFRGQDAYATSDLLVPHPEKPGLWKVFGRVDDQITLSTGEKTNPGPLELILCQHPHVASAIFFGRGRFQNGVLVQPKLEYIFDPEDMNKLIEFRNSIWPKVEELNSIAPQHSRLFKEMIITTHPSKPFVFTPKGAPKRPAILAAYEKEIDTLYATVEESVVSVDAPFDWSDESILVFVRKTVNGILKKHASDNEDIFECGCDSLQATWIRNTLSNALRNSSSASAVVPTNLPANCIYEHPRIASLAKYINSLIHTDPASARQGTTPMDMMNYLDRYSSSFPPRFPASHQWQNDEGDIVLVTGTTGTLGSAVLAKLVAEPGVKKIYALNRRQKPTISGSQRTITERQESALKTRGYDMSIIQSDKVVLVEGDLTATDLGIREEEKEIEDEIRKTVTHIIHIAWRVDFNLSLGSYETAIGGARTLIDLAISSPRSSPARFLFISSVAILRNIPATFPSIPEIPFEDPQNAIGQGYAESKWIAEQLLVKASRAVEGFMPVIVRVGQIAGSPNGNWNTNDWVPAIIKSSVTMGCLPEYKGACSWVSLDLAARAITEMRNAEPSEGILHLVHPNPALAKDLFQSIGSQLCPQLPLVPYHEWVARLETIAGELANQPNMHATQRALLHKIPALKLLEFFRGGVKVEEEIARWDEGISKEAMGIPSLRVEEAIKASKVLSSARNAQKLGSMDTGMWVKYWREVGFLP